MIKRPVTERPVTEPPMARAVMTRAAIYVRVSTTKDSQKDSPEHQIAACRHYAEDMGWETAEELIYEDRESGTSITDRHAMRQVIQDAQHGAFQVIIFAALSRFARDIGDSISLKRRMVNALNIRLISIDDHYDSERDDEMLFSIISSVNQSVSEQISRSARRGKRESALRGNFTGSRPPYGYTREMRNGLKVLVPDAAQAAVVRKLFRLYTANKLGEKAIAVYLNQAGVAAPKGGLWGITTVQRILQNEAYIGKNRSSKYETRKVYPNVHDTSERKKVLVQRPKQQWRYANKVITHEAIIDEPTFQLAQALRLERGGGARGGSRQKVNLFAGMMTCAECGASMVSLKTRNRYLVCSRRRRQGEAGCNNACWLPYAPFRDELLGSLSQLLRAHATAEQLVERHKACLYVQASDLEGERKKLHKQLADQRKWLFELRREKMSGQFHDEQQYTMEKAMYEQEVRQLERRLADLAEEQRQASDGSERYERAVAMLDELLNLACTAFDELQLVLKKLIAEIQVSRNGDVQVVTRFRL